MCFSLMSLAVVVSADVPECMHHLCECVQVITDPLTGRSKGYGFVRFGNEVERDRSLTEMSGHIINSRPIRVSVATAKKSQSSATVSLVLLLESCLVSWTNHDASFQTWDAQRIHANLAACSTCLLHVYVALRNHRMSPLDLHARA